MTENEKQEWMKNYYVKRGFTDEEKEEYNYLLLKGINLKTNEDFKFICRLYKMIELILHNDKFDYMSKLQKIYLLIHLNMSFKNFRSQSFHFPTNINKDIVS